MSEQAELNPTPPTSAMRNTVGKGKEQTSKNSVGKGKDQTSKNSVRLASDAALQEYFDKHYHQLLPIIAEKVHQKKVQQEKLKEVKARLNFEGCPERNSKVWEVSQHCESRTPNVRGEWRRGRRSKRSRSVSGIPEHANVFSRIRRDRSESSRHKQDGKGKRDDGVFNRLGDKGKSVSAHSESRYQGYHLERTESVPRKRHHERTCSRRTEMLSE
nr:reverse transcriptase domain-containing protein [Tanacetum cinerariifolium]